MSLQELQRSNDDLTFNLKLLMDTEDEHFRFLSNKVSNTIIKEIHVQAPGDSGGHGPRAVDVPGLAAVVQTLPEARAALSGLNASSLTYLPKLSGENIISMSLWGKESRYVFGVIRNAEVVQTYFPGWRLRVYVELPSDMPRHGAVPSHVLTKLRELGADLSFMDPAETNVPPMMWRFLVADDLSVDRFIIRDADSRLSARDAAGVYQWVKSGKPFHCTRDHPSHAGHAVSGGMWGGTPSGLRGILRRNFKDIMYGFREDYFEDMNFLIKVLWPRVKSHAYCVDSVSCDRWEGAVPYPIPRMAYEHVGQVFDEHELARPDDVLILRNAGENKHCSPPRTSNYVGNGTNVIS